MSDYVQVPREATEDMIFAGTKHIFQPGESWEKCVHDVYVAMLAAAPQATDPRDVDFTPEEERAWAAILQARDATIATLTAERDAEIGRLKAELESALACNRGLVRLNEVVHDRALAAESRLATLTAELAECRAKKQLQYEKMDAVCEALTAERDALQKGLDALYEWYDRDGSVGAASEVFDEYRALPSKTETRDA